MEKIPYPLSKKIIFLYPISIINDLTKELIKFGYEIYISRDPQKLLKVLEYFTESVVFINILEKNAANELEKFIHTVKDNPQLNKIQMGICVYNSSDDDTLAQRYLMEYGLTGGYINLHTNYKTSLERILKVLDASEAKGIRKFVRVTPAKTDQNSFVIIEKEEKKLKGKILDISLYCAALEFEDHYFVKDEFIKKSTIRLKGIICNSPLLVKGFHRDKDSVYIMIFLSKDEDFKEKLLNFIYDRLQAEIQSC